MTSKRPSSRSRKLALQQGRERRQQAVARRLAASAPFKPTPPASGRPGLSSLRMPPVAYRLDRALGSRSKRFFDRLPLKFTEDALRARQLQTVAAVGDFDQRAARALSWRLKRGVTSGEAPVSLASSLHMRAERLRIIGAIWQLHDEQRGTPRSVFTLLPRGFSLTPDELAAFDLIRAVAALRSDLNRAGAGSADGALTVFLHGEWDANTGRYQLHWHGWATGGMVRVVRRLRRQRKYKSTRQARAADTDGVRNRVHVSRKPIRNPAYALSYLLQSFWPSRATGELAEVKRGKHKWYRVRAKHRIPEPQHSQHLLWLDQWRIEDISLLMGMSVVQGRLQLTNSQHHKAYTNGVR